MAVTRTIDIRTDIPGPRSKEILDRKEQVVAEPLSIYLPVVIAEGHGATITDVDGNTFIDFTGRRRLPERRALASSRGRRRAGAAGEVQPHRLHDRPLRGLRRAVRTADRADPDLGREARRVLQRGDGGGRERDQVRALLHEAPGRHLLRRSLPRPDDAVDDDDLARRTRTRPGSARSRPRSTASRSRTRIAGRTWRRALAALERALLTQVAPENVAASSSSPCSARAASSSRRRSSSRACAELCDEHGIVLVVDEVQTGFGRTGKMFAIEHAGVEPDLITMAKSIAAGLPLSAVLAGGDHGRAARLRDRRHLRRQSGRAGGRARRPRRLRRGEPRRARGGARRADPRADGVVAGAISRDRRRPRARHDARDRARQGSGDARSRTPTLATAIVEAAAARGLLLLKSGIYSNCIRVLARSSSPTPSSTKRSTSGKTRSNARFLSASYSGKCPSP